MNKELAWLLGYLLSDGCINKPKYRKKGDETHLEFICKYDDREVLFKIKEILNTRAKVSEYPDYKSPQAKIRIYDRKDLIEEYSNIKTEIPAEKIKGFERHFIRGLIDGDGCLYYRANRDSFVLNFIDEYECITRWVVDTICEKLKLPQKDISYREKDHIWTVSWEGSLARLIAFWLYSGDIENCCLKRKLDKYKEAVLHNQKFNSLDEELIYSVKAYIDENNEIAFKVPSLQTLDWAKRLQKLLSFNTTPVFHNKGRRKYYHLYIPNKPIVNTRDAS